MAITAISGRGNAGSSTNNAVMSVTPTATVAVGRLLVMTIVSDNTATSDGDQGEILSVTDTSNNKWYIAGQYTNSNGSAAAGVTTGVAYSVISTQLTTGSTVTANFVSNRTDKCGVLYEYSITSWEVVVTPGTVTGNGTDASNGFGSAAITSLSSAERLYFRGLGKEVNTTKELTVTSNFTTIPAARSRNNALAVILRGEFRINTSTGETSNPTLAVSGDTAGLFVALEEKRSILMLR